MQPQLTAGARRAGVTHSLRHFRKADATRVKVQTMRIWHHGPFSRGDGARSHGPARGRTRAQPDRTLKDVRAVARICVGNAQGAFGSVNFQTGCLTFPNIKADQHLTDYAALELN